MYNNLVQKGFFSPESISIIKVKTMFSKDGTTMTAEEAIKRILIFTDENIPKNQFGLGLEELYKKMGLTDDVKPLSLDAREARVWYLYQETLIDGKFEKFKQDNPNSTLEEQARFCCDLRNSIRAKARDAMIDVELSLYLNGTEMTTFEDLLDKRKKQVESENPDLDPDTEEGIQQILDKSYKKIIKGSKQSRTILNDLLGIVTPK